MNFLDTMSTLHTRGVSADWKDYVFALLITSGEDKEVAYALAYEPSEFNKNRGEDEGEYLASKKRDAEVLLDQQYVKMLIDIMNDARRSEIQSQALNLEDYRFSVEDTVQILNGLLKSRIDDIDSASVKDVIQLLKALTEQGALDVGDGGFGRHFVQIFPKFSALCPKCGREFDAQRGLSAKCPHCSQVYQWSEEEHRYYPEPMKL